MTQKIRYSDSGLLYLNGWIFRIAEFGLVQGLVQVITALSGFLIIRTLSKPEYALFAIVNSMQTACNLLADLGIGVGVRSIGGQIYDDRVRFGQLLNTALALRRRFAAFSLSCCLPITVWMLWRSGGSAIDIIGLSAIVVIGVYPLLASSVFNVSAQLHREYRRIQKVDFGNAFMRLILIGLLAISHMNALLTASVGVIANWIQAFFLRRWACNRADLTATINADDRIKLQKLSMQSLPNTVFFCFQGQVTLFILSMFGNRNGIADVTAIGRIAALLTLFSMVFSNVLAPQFNRCRESARLPRLYLTLVFGISLLLSPILLTAWLFPSQMLWILGGKYSGLESECVWVVAGSSLSLVGGVMWTLNSSRAWIRVQAVGYIPIILTAQIIAALCLNLHLFHDVIIFNLVSGAAPIPMFILDAYVGLRALRIAQGDKP
jgi:hypothetical protein